MSRGSDQFALRFPDGLREKVKTLAESNRRSMNAEIVLAVEDHIKRPQKRRAKRPAKAR